MSRHTLFFSLTTALILAGACARAQDFNHEGPKPVPKLTPPGPRSATSTSTSTNATPDNQVLLKNLKGVVFVPTPDKIVSGGTHATGIVLRGVTVPAPAEFDKRVQPYLGHPLTHSRLNELIADLISFYRGHDRPIIDVIVPEQEITNGVVQLVLLEGRVGSTTVTGNRWFPSGEFLTTVNLRPGEPISGREVQSDVDFLNQNPFHSTDVVYRPGKQVGQTDLVLQTTDRFPVRFYGGYDNSGNEETGLDRYDIGFNWGDAFDLGLGQQLNYQYTTSGDGEGLRSHAGSYIIPLPWHHTLTFFGSYADTKGVIPPLIDLKGRSYQISGGYGIPLPTLTWSKVTLKENFSFGFDYKYNNNSLEFGAPGSGGPGVSTLVDVDQFVFGYDGTENDPYGQFTVNETLNFSPGSFGGNNSDAAYNLSHTGATSDYIYDTVSLQRLTRLPYDFSLVLRATVQASNGNLTPSEQLGFGGYDTIRGYDEREVNSDEGFIFSTELRSPPISIAELFGSKIVHDQLQFLGFWDYGAASNHAPLAGEASEIPLSSLGLGLRYTINSYLSLRYDYGFQLLGTGFDNDHGNGSELGVVVSY